MVFTSKQERNGTAIGGEGHNTAVAADATPPAPSALVAAAMAAGAAYSDDGGRVFAGGGFAGTVSTEWDAGLAISDVEGGGSG